MRELYGLATVARHELITARMTRGAERVLRLIEEGRHTEAQALLNTGNWCEEGGNGWRNATGKYGFCFSAGDIMA